MLGCAYPTTYMFCALCPNAFDWSKPCIGSKHVKLLVTFENYSEQVVDICGACMREIDRDLRKLEDFQDDPERVKEFLNEWWNWAEFLIWNLLENRKNEKLAKLTWLPTWW